MKLQQCRDTDYNKVKEIINNNDNDNKNGNMAENKNEFVGRIRKIQKKHKSMGHCYCFIERIKWLCVHFF